MGGSDGEARKTKREENVKLKVAVNNDNNLFFFKHF